MLEVYLRNSGAYQRQSLGWQANVVIPERIQCDGDTGLYKSMGEGVWNQKENILNVKSLGAICRTMRTHVNTVLHNLIRSYERSEVKQTHLQPVTQASAFSVVASEEVSFFASPILDRQEWLTIEIKSLTTTNSLRRAPFLPGLIRIFVERWGKKIDDGCFTRISMAGLRARPEKWHGLWRLPRQSIWPSLPRRPMRFWWSRGR